VRGTRRLVVFDCDGVLVDSERLVIDIDVRAIRELGWQITRDEVIHRHLGMSVADVLVDIEDQTGQPVPEGWAEGWEEEYRCVFAERLEAVPGVLEAVRSLSGQGYAVCVASSGSHEKIRRNLDRTGLRGLLGDALFSSSDVPNGKPAPDLFLHAASTLGFDPRDCVVVEDSRHGVAAARAAGMRVVGYAGGVTPESHLTGADAVITEMCELPRTVQAVLAGPSRA